MAPRPQKWSISTKKVKITKVLHFLLERRTQQLLHWQPTTVISLNDFDLAFPDSRRSLKIIRLPGNKKKRPKSAKKRQNIPKTAVFAATGDPTVVLSSTNCSTFMRPTSAKKRENNQKYTLFAVMGEPTASCFIGNQLLYFYEVTK